RLGRDALHVERVHALRHLPGRDRRTAPATGRPLRPARRGIGPTSMRARWFEELVAPIGLVVVLAVASSLFVSSADQAKFQTAIVNVAIVAALYVFVGNSGV